MKIIKQFILFLFGFVNSLKVWESLDIVQLDQKKLFEFHFDYEQNINIQNIVSENTILNRGMIDMLLIKSKLTKSRVSMANGNFNELYFENNQFHIELPQQGVQIQMDQNADHDVLPIFLAEIFGFTQKNILNSLQEIKDFQNNTILYASDPSDFICSDNILKIKRFLKCDGNQGLMQLIDPYLIFKSDFIGFHSDVEYNQQDNKFSINFQFFILIDNLQLNQIININQIDYCQAYQKSQIKIHQLNQTIINLKNQKIINMPQLNSLEKFISNEMFQNKSLKINKFMTQSRLSFESSIVFEFKNLQNQPIQLKFQQFLPFYLHPSFHLIKSNKKNKLTFQITQKQSDIIIQFDSLIILPQDNLIISIPVEKLMKSFEEYPYNPTYGHYLPSEIVFYQLNSNQHNITTNSLIFTIPEPDFSTPFNTMTFTMALLSYIFITVFQLTVYRDNIFTIQKQSFINKILQKIIILFKK